MQHPVPPEVSPPAANPNIPITTTAVQSPASAANELREMGKTLQDCNVYVKRDQVRCALTGVSCCWSGAMTWSVSCQANGRRVKDLLNTIMGRTAQPARTISCAVTEDGLHALGPQGVTDTLRGMAYIGERFAFVQEMSAILQASLVTITSPAHRPLAAARHRILTAASALSRVLSSMRPGAASISLLSSSQTAPWPSPGQRIGPPSWTGLVRG